MPRWFFIAVFYLPFSEYNPPLNGVSAVSDVSVLLRLWTFPALITEHQSQTKSDKKAYQIMKPNRRRIIKNYSKSNNTIVSIQDSTCGKSNEINNQINED